MLYKVIQKREVPTTHYQYTSVGQRPVLVENLNPGHRAILIELDNGAKAWGYGATWELATTNAYNNAEIKWMSRKVK